MVQPPLCKVCGNAHWGVAHVFDEAKAPPAVTPVTAKPVTPRNASVAVTLDRNVARICELEAEVERLTAEVRQLKRQLADRVPRVASDQAMSAAERMRRMRAKRKGV